MTKKSKDEALSAVAGKRLVEWDVEGHGDVVFQQPSRAAYMRLVSELQDGEKYDPSTSMLAFVKACLVYPDQKTLDALLEDYPGFVGMVSEELQNLARPAAKAIVKKG